MVHGNFTRIFHEISGNYSLLELCDIQECHYLENSFTDDFKFYHEHMKEKRGCMLKPHKELELKGFHNVIKEHNINVSYLTSSNEANALYENIYVICI